MPPTHPVDLVCGRPLERWDSALDVIHQGRLYRFCSRACQQRFVREPGGYAVDVGPVRRREFIILEIVDLGCGGQSASLIERALADVPGVLSAHVNPATERAYVECNSDVVREAGLLAEIRGLGYRAHVARTLHDR